MKKLLGFILFATALLSLSSCEKVGEIWEGWDGYIVDWAPVNVYLKVTDSQGIDLLDPGNPGNMIDGTTITFKGKTYEASREERYGTKAYLAHIYGLVLVKDVFQIEGSPLGYSLVFGEIDGSADMDENLLVTLPDGTKGTIHYHCAKHNERKLSCERIWKFNGKKTEGNLFTFVVPE